MAYEDPVLYASGLPLTERDTFAVDLETASGSRYRVTWHAEDRRGTLTRETAPDSDEHPMSQPLRRDGELLPLLGFDRIDLGHRTEFIVDVRSDGVPTSRWANPSVRIEGIGWDRTPAAGQAEGGGLPILSGDKDEPGLIALSNGVLGNVHPRSACADQPWGCWVHSPLPHALDRAPVHWREDKGTAERICGHGIGHPDPQDVAYWWNTHGRDVTIHGCDGCCGPRPEWATELGPPA